MAINGKSINSHTINLFAVRERLIIKSNNVVHLRARAFSIMLLCRVILTKLTIRYGITLLSRVLNIKLRGGE